MTFNSEPLKEFSFDIGWETFYISANPEFILSGK